MGNEAAQRLRERVKGLSDNDIIRNAEASQGVDGAIAEVFDGMAKAFLPDRAKGQTGVVQYDVATPKGVVTYQVNVAAGACIVAPGADKTARATLSVSFPDFLRLISGQLNGIYALMSGKLKVKGDLSFAKSMQGWFDRAN